MTRCHRLKFVLVVAALFVLAGPISVAVADDGAPPTVPDDVAAAAQYRESVPTASGRVPSRAGNGPGATLPGEWRRWLDGGGLGFGFSAREAGVALLRQLLFFECFFEFGDVECPGGCV